MIIKIQQPENSVERVDNGVIVNLYNAHINGNISQELNEDNQKVGLIGSITADGGYENQVSTLTSAYPKFHCSVTKTYLQFEDSNVYTVLRNQGIGDSFGISVSDLDGLYIEGNGNNGGITFKNNTDIEYFEEFKYFTNFTGGHNGPFANCTNLKFISLPSTYSPPGDGFFYDTNCNVIVPSLKWLMEFNYVRRDAMPGFNNQYDYYIGDRNHKLVDVVVTYDMTPTGNNDNRKFQGTSIETVTWESDTNIPANIFRSASHLNTVTVTGNITSIAYAAFANCSSLVNVTLPQTCTTFNQEAFSNCTSLTSTINLSNCSSIGSYAFNGCQNAEFVVDFTRSQILYGHCFQDCRKLGLNQDLDIDLDVVTFGNNWSGAPAAFSGTGYRSVTLHETSLHKIEGFSGNGEWDIFSHMPNVTKYDLSDTKQTSITSGGGNFSATNLTTIITSPYFSTTNFSTFEFGTYTGILYYIILATSVPTATDSAASYWNLRNANVYVLDNLVEDYKVATGWSRIASKIKGISELPAEVTWYTKEHPTT